MSVLRRLCAAARYVATGQLPAVNGSDEDGTPGTVLGSLERDARQARDESVRAADAERRAHDYAALLAEASAALSRQLAEVRMPLHILADSPFGELNENQEEMIAAARAAAEEAEGELARLRAIADVDRGALVPSLESVQPADLIRSLVPLLEAQGAKEGVALRVVIEPDVPRVIADRARLRDALRLALLDAVRFAIPGATVHVHTLRADNAAVVEARHGSRHEHTGNLLLAQRIVAVQGGSVADADGVTRIVMPAGG